mmetsp:Transcript_13721/g.19971  ORF Transcript_13721/g.19971 Transcript_13721/m.19971 type:complete len:141 (+) Transcript_13721:636-1058(+)
MPFGVFCDACCEHGSRSVSSWAQGASLEGCSATCGCSTTWLASAIALAHLHKGALFSLSCLFLFPLSLSSLNNSCMCVWCSEGTGWAGTVEVDEGSYEYKYILDECMWIHDQHLVTLFATTRSFLHLSIVALGRSRGLLW